MTTSHAKGWLADFLILAAIWGSSFLFMRVAAVELGALPTAAIRVAIASVFLLPLMLSKGHWAELRQHWKPVLFVGCAQQRRAFRVVFVCGDAHHHGFFVHFERHRAPVWCGRGLDLVG